MNASLMGVVKPEQQGTFYSASPFFIGLGENRGRKGFCSLTVLVALKHFPRLLLQHSACLLLGTALSQR